MSNGDNRGLLKFVSAIKSTGKRREYVDSSTIRSRPQHKQQRSKKSLKSNSYSPSPSTKRKRQLTESDSQVPSAKGIRRYTMSATPKPNQQTTQSTPAMPKERKKLTPDLEDLRTEVFEDMNKLISPLKESIELLLGF